MSKTTTNHSFYHKFAIYLYFLDKNLKYVLYKGDLQY